MYVGAHTGARYKLHLTINVARDHQISNELDDLALTIAADGESATKARHKSNTF